MKVLVVGLGNPVLGDDGVGWHIAERVEQQLQDGFCEKLEIDVECLSLGGISLMEHLIGYDRAILIDAINLGNKPLGSLHYFELGELQNQSAGHLSSTHDTTLQTALEVGQSMGAKLPDHITVIGVESPYVYDFSEELTPTVASAVPGAVDLVLRALQENVCTEQKEV